MRYSLLRYRPASRRAIQRQTEETVLFFCEIFYENNAGEQLIWEQMLISANNALTLVLDNEYDAEEEHVIGGHIATVYTYVDGYVMAYYEADNYVYVITADHMTAEEMFQLIASMDI